MKPEIDPEDFLNASSLNTPTIDELAAHVPSYSDDFTLPPLIPTVEDALVLPRQTDATLSDIQPPDALQFMTSSPST